MKQFPLGTSRDRFVMNCPESDTRQIITVKFCLQFVRINPFGCKSLEGIANADVQISVKFACNSR